MLKRLLASTLAALLLVSAGAAPAQPPVAPPAAAVAPPRAPAPPLPPATEPRPRDDARHKAFLEIANKGDIDILFVGDSITDWWQQANRGLPVWQERYVPLKAADFGIAGDTTQGVLWRMQNGELDGFKAKLIVLMLGTNNINRNDNADIAAGDAAIIAEFRKHQPQAKVLILGIFPRGAAPDNPFRPKIKEINGYLAKLADNRKVYYLDIGDKFLTADGTLTTEIMADGLHPTTKGYVVWADAQDPTIKKLMRKPWWSRIFHN
ncbi:hypothetical protein BH11PSE2_BH11PSE2_03700 [soil metagenome]